MIMEDKKDSVGRNEENLERGESCDSPHSRSLSKKKA